MSDETDGLIERAAAVLRQSGSPRPESNLGGDRPRPYSQDSRANRAEDHIGLGHPAPPAQFEPSSKPIPAQIVS
jgi:hypothetical protein